MQTAVVRYQIATYSGVIGVQCDENDENEIIIAKAQAMLRRKVGHFPLGHQSFKVVERKQKS